MSYKTKVLWVCNDRQVEGVCIDCGLSFKGEIGLRFVETSEGPGVEACIWVAGTAHPIACALREVMPTLVAA